MSEDLLISHNQISLYRGESATITLRVVDSNNKYVDLTGGSIILTVKTSIDDTIPLIQKSSLNISQISIILPREGTAEIYISPSDTMNLNIFQYIYDVWVALPSGKRHPVIKPSIFEIKKSVTVFTS